MEQNEFKEEKKQLKKNKKNGLDKHENMTCMSNRWSQTRKRLIYESKVCTQSFHKTILMDTLGPFSTWGVPQMKFSEWDWVRTLYARKQAGPLIRISATTVWSLLLPFLGFGFWAKSRLTANQEIPPVYIGSSDYPPRDNEEWWYLSGTGVNEDLQAANAIHLAHIFKRQIRLFYNPTNGFVFDLARSLIGLMTYKSHPPRRLGHSLMARYNLNPSAKTVLIGHSYGTIVIVNAMKYLIKKGRFDCLRNVEIYTFGCPCIDIASTIDPVSMTRVPFYEHYVNIGDFVARVGAYRLLGAHHWVVGKVFTADKQGHLLGEHYLPSLVSGEYQWEGGNTHSRLMKYMPQGDDLLLLHHQLSYKPVMEQQLLITDLPAGIASV